MLLFILNLYFLTSLKIALFLFLALLFLWVLFKLLKRRKETKIKDYVTSEDLHLEDNPLKLRAKKTYERGGIKPINTVFNKSSTALDFKRLGVATKKTKNNLQKIKGIGPEIEKKLNSVGIFTFKQISNFNSKDIALITKLIAFFPSRIERHDWVGQAFIFLDKK